MRTTHLLVVVYYPLQTVLSMQVFLKSVRNWQSYKSTDGPFMFNSLYNICVEQYIIHKLYVSCERLVSKERQLMFQF